MGYLDPNRKREYNIAYREKNLEQLRAYDRSRVRSPEQMEKQRAYQKKWSEEHKDHRRAVNQKWYQELKSDPTEYSRHRAERREWERNNPEKRGESARKYWGKNPEKLAVKRRVGSTKRKARVRSAPGKFTSRQVFDRWIFYGMRCAYCLTPLESFKKCHIDHVIPLAAGGTNWPSNLVPACKKCNLRKGVKRWLPRWLQKVAA